MVLKFTHCAAVAVVDQPKPKSVESRGPPVGREPCGVQQPFTGPTSISCTSDNLHYIYITIHDNRITVGEKQ